MRTPREGGLFNFKLSSETQAARRRLRGERSTSAFCSIWREDWQQHGREVFKRVRRESPASYLKVCAMLVPKELKFEHSGGVKAMTDEQLERGIELIKEMLAQREAGANAKVIEGTAERVPELGLLHSRTRCAWLNQWFKPSTRACPKHRKLHSRARPCRCFAL